MKSSSTATRVGFDVSEFTLLDDSEKLEAAVANGERLERTLHDVKAYIEAAVSPYSYPSAMTKTVGVFNEPDRLRAPEKLLLVSDIEPSAVPLHALVRFASAFSFVVCALSIVLWISDLPFVVTPFAALLGMVAAPFFYAMGVKIRTQTMIARGLSSTRGE